MSLLVVLLGTSEGFADQVPPGCTGSAIGINLFTSASAVHIGDTIRYSATVFNNLPGSPKLACEAKGIVAGIVTPDGKTNFITLLRTALQNGQSDFYADIASYAVRAQDILPDGTVRATAFDSAIIHQNPTDSRGAAEQGVNTEVSQPCISIAVQCVGSVGETGAITFTGTIQNCGNTALSNVTITNSVNGGLFRVAVIGTLNLGQSAPFSGSWIPANPCAPSTATFVAYGTDSSTTVPVTRTATASTTCAATLNPGIVVTKVCPTTPVAPGQQLVYTGTVSNNGNVTLKNVVVVSDQPGPQTTVLTLASLAPGASANYSGSYVAPVDCSTTSTVTARGTSTCGVDVTSTAGSTCPILTAPGLQVTVVCPPGNVAPGGQVNYTGTVRNTGNIGLKNLTVVSDRPAPNTSVFAIGNLAPGASATFTGSYTAPTLNACAVTTTVIASAQDVCTDKTVTSTAPITCGITTAPQIAVSVNCPDVAVAVGSPITYAGTVSNTGNVTLNNVTVVDNQASPSTVLTIPSLAPGASANFTARFTAPADGCSVSTTVTATGADACTSAAVSKSASATCTLASTPRLVITQECPVTPVSPGGVVRFTGTVRNSGDITITNVVVVNDRGGATPVFTAASLAPGATVPFSGSFTVDANVCSVTSTSTVRGTSICGVAVSNTASGTCTVLTAPAIAVTTVCGTNTVIPGGTLAYGGTVRNTGNVTLKDVTVVSDRPAANTTLFTVATLAPGASANFTGSYAVPQNFTQNACGVTATVSASGKDLCTDKAVTATAAATCGITTAPQISVTVNCPASTAPAGGPVTFTGTVSNTGNIALNNVTVVNNQSTPGTVFTVATLAPGASANFTSTVSAPADTCSITTTVTASGSDNCTSQVVTKSASATCPLLTSPAIAVTQVCPPTPVKPGGAFTYGGTVRNSGNVTLKNVIVTDDRNGTGGVVLTPGTPPSTTLWFDDDLPAGAQRSTDGVDSWRFIEGNPKPFSGRLAHQSEAAAGLHQHYFTSATAGLPVNTGDVLVAYVFINPLQVPAEIMLQWSAGGFEHRAFWGADLINLGFAGTGSRRFMGPLPPTGQWVRLEVPAVAVGLENTTLTGMAFTLFDGQVSWDAVGKATTGSQPDPVPVTGNPATVFTIASLAPGQTASFTGTFTAPTNGACTITSRTVATGADNCTGTQVTANASITCPVVPTPIIEVVQACPDGPVIQGSTITFTATVKNLGDVILNNVKVLNDRNGPTPVFTTGSLAPGESRSFTGTFVVPLNCCTVSSTATASGTENCTGSTVIDTSTTTCLVVTAPAIVVTKTCPDKAAALGERLTYTGTVGNTGNITLRNVTVVNNHPGAETRVIGPIALLPGEVVKFTSSYIVAQDFCGTDTLTARGTGLCGGTVTNSVTTTCPIAPFHPAIAVTKNCPPSPTPKAGPTPTPARSATWAT